jgi:hypothetical protein
MENRKSPFFKNHFMANLAVWLAMAALVSEKWQIFPFATKTWQPSQDSCNPLTPSLMCILVSTQVLVLD